MYKLSILFLFFILPVSSHENDDVGFLTGYLDTTKNRTIVQSGQFLWVHTFFGNIRVCFNFKNNHCPEWQTPNNAIFTRFKGKRSYTRFEYVGGDELVLYFK
ncbi:MAG: hypothetical protein COB45_08815 [Gammaproteobacteria bacterium]|nr:MAG: hypothetical protein COB45_08815 [Gammaproteobacteria bacterium]